MQGKVRSSGERQPSQNRLKLGSGFQSLHNSAKTVWHASNARMCMYWQMPATCACD
jgi:hypothetical protein